MDESVRLIETRSNRVYMGTGTRIKGIYIGGGQSSSVDVKKEIDTGTLTLTSQRLVFTGSKESRNFNLEDLSSINVFGDAIEVGTRKKAKNSFFTVKNSLIWNQFVRGLLDGTITPKPKT